MPGSIAGVSLGSAAQMVAQASAPAGPGKGAAAAPVAAPSQCAADSEAAKSRPRASETQTIASTAIEFSTYGKQGEQIAITITDRNTGRVIRELPPKEIQRLYEKLNELASASIDQKA